MRELLMRVRGMIECYEAELSKIETEQAQLACVARRLRFLQEQDTLLRRLLDDMRATETQLLQREVLPPLPTEEIP